MRIATAALIGLFLMSAGAAAQQCNFRCVCADTTQSSTVCPNLTATECSQAAERASVGGVKCSGTMAPGCQASGNIASPPGSYAQSCQECQHDCTFLLCNCRKSDGTLNQTGIRYATCPEHSVANKDGMLTCAE